MTEVEEKKESLESKEEVICPVCSNFEPQAWRKNMCRNCFHGLDEHGANSEENVDSKTTKDKKLENDKVNDMQKKKFETDTSKKKGEPPKTLPKSKNPNLSVDISKKDTSGSVSKSPVSPLKKPGSSLIKSPEVKDVKISSPLSPTKVTADLKSKGKLFSSTSPKNAYQNKLETKRTESSKDNEKQVASAPSTLSKWKQNENRSVSKDKGPSGEENKQTCKQELSKLDNKNKIEEKASKFQSKNDKKEQDVKTPIASSLTKEDNTPKSKTDDASKVRQFAKTFGSDLEESRFNSLERQKKEKSATKTLANDQCKSGIKNQSTSEPTQKGTISTDGREKESSALYDKISRFTQSGLKKVDKNDKSSGYLDKRRQSEDKSGVTESSAEAGRRIDADLETVKKQLSVLEIKCKSLEQENDKLRTGLKEKEVVESSLKSQKTEVENAIKTLHDTLQSMENRCNKLEGDNSTLLDKVKTQQKEQQEAMTEANKTEIEDMEVKLSESENDIEDIRNENDDLKQEINDLKVEMEEMYDSFRDQEAEEFRELQRELEMTAKNCRVLQFKLRKAERRTEQIEIDRQTYEEKLHLLQNQFEDADARAHIRSIEEELRMAKEVSVRLHDELDILDDKRQKVEEDNSHLTRLLEQSDKKQFRLEMEVDKLRDQMADLRRQVAERSQAGTPATEEASDRKQLLGRIGKQGSQEQDISQLMKDLYDSMERETDLKDQLKFAEEETKSMRKKLEELEEENDTLSQQLKKMSSIHVTRREEPAQGAVTETEVELKVQLDLNEQDLLLSKKKIQDYGNENEKLKEEIANLKKMITEKDQLLHVMPEPSSPNAYYEDKLKEMNLETDDLRWRIIEKEREINCLYVQLSNYQTKQASKLRKTDSFDSEYSQVVDLKKHVEYLTHENADLKYKLKELEENRNQWLHKSKSPIRIESQVFESSRQSPAKSNVEMIGKTSLSDANVMFVNSKDGNYLPTPSDQTSMSIITDKNSQDSTVSGISKEAMAKQNDNTERFDQKLNAVELENQNLQLKVSELMKENEILQKKIVNSMQENASTKDATNPKCESREELMDTILDLEEEIESLSAKLKQRTEETASLLKKEKEYQRQIENIEDDYRKKELDLLNDLDFAQDKNEILSNLLDIVKERADTAERELERIAASFSVASDVSGRSARVISTCSDVSIGSDEVFDGTSPGVSPGLSPVLPGSPESPLKRQVVQRDWDSQFRKRIDCLERLLAEERQKLAATEKKLALVSTETISTAMSDDAKLFAREKELLQAEILEGKKLLKIATDQIKGLRERMFTLEEENRCLRANCAAEQVESEESENEKTPSYHIDEKPSFDVAVKDASKTQTTSDISNYRERIASLEKQLKEVGTHWRSKCTTVEKEKNESQQRLRELTEDSETLRGSLKGFKEDVCNKQKQLREIEEKITVNSDILKRKEEIINEQEEIIKQREEDLQLLLDQISHKEIEIRDLREKLHPVDEKLKDKEDIIKSLKDVIESKQDEINYQTEEISELHETIELKQNEIDELSGNSNVQNVTKAEWEQDNKQLKGDLETMASNLGKLHTDNCTLQEELEKTKQALSEAMVLWNKDRSQIEIAYNVAKEKLRMYEETAAKKESQIVALLRKETHKLLESKEKTSTDFRVSKIEHEANMRTLKSEKLKLQDELTQKIRQLTAEMTSNDRMKEELERLRAQEEVAYQIQYHEKVLRAEYLAMKVRYETRLENLQKEHMKLLGVLDKLQREKVLNQEMIKGVQKGMGNMKETYTKDLEHWKEERNVLEKHIKEIESSRKLATDLEGKVEELKQQLADQEYERAEIVNRMTSERSKWEVERSGMQSCINQLEEKLDTIAYSQYKTKDMQSRMEVAWESERAEQKRLLNEAHELAMDLQRQLKCRDDEHSRERKALLEQLKKLRKELDEEQLLREKRLTQIESSKKEIEELKKKLKDMCCRSEKDQDSTMKEKVDLVRRLAEFRRIHKRDQRRIEDVLSELTRLRELASIVVDSENPDMENDIISRLEQLSKPSSESKRISIHANTDLKHKINEIVMQYMKESLKEIHFAADNLSRPSSRGSSEDERRKLRRSISSSELDFLLKDEVAVDHQIETLKDSRRSTPTKHHDLVGNRLRKNICSHGPGDLMDVRTDDLDTEMIIDPEPGTVSDRHQRIMIDVHHEEGVTSRFPVPPPSFLLPKSQYMVSVTSHSSKSLATSTTVTPTSSRQLPNSLSLNLLSDSSGGTSSFPSASTHMQNNFDLPNPKSKSDINISSNNTRLSKEDARRKFFENLEDVNGNSSDSKSMSENNLSIANNRAVIPEDSKTHVGIECTTEVSKKHGCSSSDSEPRLNRSGNDELHSKSGQPKKKRKLFKKSVSMDSSPVHSTLADAGVSAISPGAPSSLSPFELFAAVKRRLKPSLKRSSSLTEGRKGHYHDEGDRSKQLGHIDAYASSSYSSRDQSLQESPISTPTAYESQTSESGSLIPPHTPPISMMNRRILPKLQELHEDDDERKGRRKKTEKKKKFRSKSAERAKSGPASLSQDVVFHEDLATPLSHSPFSETSV